MRAWVGAAAVASLALPNGAADAQDFDNAGVVALHRAGLGADAIVAKIGTSPCHYDVSTAALIDLRKADVSSSVIAAMIERCAPSLRAEASSLADPTAAHPPGIYVMHSRQGAATMALIRPARPGTVKVSGNGSVFFPRKSTLVIPDAASRNVVETGAPTFYFYFTPDDRRGREFGTADPGAAHSPDDFSLVPLKRGDQVREVSIGRVNSLRGRVGIDLKTAIPFSAEEIGDSIYKVTLPSALPTGEYAFVITGANNAARVYDFAVR